MPTAILADGAIKVLSTLKEFFKRLPLGSALHTHLKAVSRYKSFVLDFHRFRCLTGDSGPRFPLRWQNRFPCLDDKTATTGFDRHYIYHPAWAARILAKTEPDFHVDISSSLHFVSLVSAFLPVKFYDYRPADLHLNNLSCEKADLLALPFRDASVKSLSCMHVVEHVGLGRYGDPLDPDGDLKAMRELQRVLAPEGSFLFVVPVGKPVLQFNAHRIYSHSQILDQFSELVLQEFTLIPESPEGGPPIRNASKEQTDREHYGCGCFWFKRLP